MTWNPPALFSVSEVVTAAKMNQIRESLLYLKGQAGAIVPEDVIAPVRNDGASAFTIERTSAIARKYGLLIGASGDFGINDLTAGVRRFSIASNGQISIPGAVVLSSSLFTNGQTLLNGFASSSIAGLGVTQANNHFIFVGAENITSSTVILFSGITRGVSGSFAAFGSGATGWLGQYANRSITLGTGAVASWSSGDFIVELTAGGVLQARRVAGAQTWDVSCVVHLR